MMRHLIRAELYRLRHTRAALWLAGADLVCLLLLWAVRFAPSVPAAGDAADFINRCVLPALPVNAALLCSAFCGGDLRARRVAGFSNGRILFASVFACWAYLAAVYAAAFGICCAFGAYFGFGYSSVFAYLMRFVCGCALLFAWCAVFGNLSFAVQERAAAALWCAVWLAAELVLSELLSVLGNVLTVSGGGSPVTILFTLAASMFLPGGSARMLAAGGSGYPLYILLPLSFAFVCVRIGFRLRARKELY